MLRLRLGLTLSLSGFRIGSLIITSLLLLVALAPQASTQAQAPAQAVITQDNLPQSQRLEGLRLVWQDINRCSAAALTIQLSYYMTFTDLSGAYNEVVRQLNPRLSDASVRIEEMGALAEAQGLGSIVRRGGTVELLKQLVANGFPVLIENVYYDGPNGWNDWMSHNRVLMGYDDAVNEFYFYDPLRGAGQNAQGYAMTYDDVAQRWRPFNYDYLVLYRPEEEAKLQEVLGAQWDAAYNAQWTLSLAQAEIDSGNADSFTYFNRGWAELQLDLYEDAAASFDRALSMGLPWRMLWYEFGPFEAYLEVGRYDDVIREVRRTIAGLPEIAISPELNVEISIEELYYYIAQAYLGQGNTERAIANLDAALYRKPNFIEARELMDSLTGGTNS